MVPMPAARGTARPITTLTSARRKLPKVDGRRRRFPAEFPADADAGVIFSRPPPPRGAPCALLPKEDRGPCTRSLSELRCASEYAWSLIHSCSLRERYWNMEKIFRPSFQKEATRCGTYSGMFRPFINQLIWSASLWRSNSFNAKMEKYLFDNCPVCLAVATWVSACLRLFITSSVGAHRYAYSELNITRHVVRLDVHYAYLTSSKCRLNKDDWPKAPSIGTKRMS